MEKIPVLFICTGNSARGLMAHAFLQKHGEHLFFVNSGGIEPRGIDALAITVMKEKDIDISSYESQNIQDFVRDQHYSYIISLSNTADQKAPIFPGVAYRLSWPMENPASFNGSDEEKLHKYREIRDQIETKITSFIKEVEEKTS